MPDAALRADLLAFLPGLPRGIRRPVRRAERWRRRGWTARELAEATDAVAAALGSRGVGPGDRVAVHVGDGPLWHAAFYGVLRAGAVAVPLDAALDPDLLRERARAIGVAAWCSGAEVPDLGLDLPAVRLGWDGLEDPRDPGPPPPWPADDPDRLAEVVLTSGTSGVPQAVPVTHRNLRAVLDALAAGVDEHRRALALAPALRLAVALPLSHLYGQVLGAFVPGILDARATLVATMPAPDLARTLRAEGAWALATVPRTLELLAAHLRAAGEERWGPDGLERRLEAARGRPWPRRWVELDPLRRLLGRRLVAVVSGGAALEPGTERFWRDLGYAVLQGYGLTETAPLVTLNHPFDDAPGSLGRPLPGVALRTAPDGEILVRGPNVVVARLGGRAVDEAGWLHTGDLGRIDAGGRLWFLGRKGERIVTPAGVNVDPEPVVAALRSRPGVLDAVVLERPWGEPGVVSAVLALRPGADPAAAVRAANDLLPDAARVRDWRVWPEADFPRTRTGKPRRPALRAWLEERAPAGTGSPPSAPPPTGDPFTALARLAASIAGVDAGALSRDDRAADVLGSLDRVELVTRVEATYGVTLGPEAFGPDRTLGEIADLLLAAAGRPASETSGPPAPTSAPARAEPPEAEPGIREAAPPPTPAPGPGPAGPRVSRAPWRGLAPVRAGRFLLREAVLRPLWGTLVDLDVGGLERLAGLDPPCLFAANHVSELDPGPVLFGLPPRFRRGLATAALWEWFLDARLAGFFYRLAVFGIDLVPLVQSGDWRPTLEVAGGIADRGGSILVFPEGERSLDGRLLPFRRGAAIMARDLHLPVVPCGIAGLLPVFPRGAHWPRNCWTSRAPVAVRFGEPIPAPGRDADPDALTERIRERVEALHAEALRAAGAP